MSLGLLIVASVCGVYGYFLGGVVLGVMGVVLGGLCYAFWDSFSSL